MDQVAFRAAIQGRVMLPQEILALAQQGHPIAIGTLLNYSGRSQGIKTRVRRQNHCLHVLLEARQPLNQDKAIAFVQSSVRILNVKAVRTIMVYSRQQGSASIDWQQTVKLSSSLDSSPADASPFDPALLDSPPSPAPVRLSSRRSLPPRPFPDLPLSRRDPVTQASNVFPESLEPAAMPSAAGLHSADPPSDPPPSDKLQSDTPEILKRPESVIFLLFISLFLFWDAYVELLEGGFSPETTAISASHLARRLKVSRKVIRRRKREPGFSSWAQSLDPEGIAWVYRKGYYLSQP